VRNIQQTPLRRLVAAIFAKAGCGGEEAETIARRLVDSNLAGHCT
jgi:LDH2 family malate/lactate/ureidoglycolate dehydrogenase